MFPETVADYWAYFDDMVANTLEDHPTAHDVLDAVRRTGAPPYLPGVLRRRWGQHALGANRVNLFLIVGTLPPAVRDKLGLDWSAADERRLRRFGRAVAAVAPRLPERLRYLPLAYRARVLNKKRVP
jgi:uncharacterized protein (DUF2236 family)